MEIAALRRFRPRSSGQNDMSMRVPVDCAALRGATRRSATSSTTLGLRFRLVAGDCRRLSFFDEPSTKRLPHEIPAWVDPHRQIYFITINCRERFRNQLANPSVSEPLFETIRHRQENFLWWPHLWLLMPDHLHALISFHPRKNVFGEFSENGRSGPRNTWGSCGNAISSNIACGAMRAASKRQFTF